MSQRKSEWNRVAEAMDRTDEVLLQAAKSSDFYRLAGTALSSCARYKFAAKMIGKGKRVLDVECGEGLGTWVLAKECGTAVGIDCSRRAIELASRNWTKPAVSFEVADLHAFRSRPWDAVVALDAGKPSGRKLQAFFTDIKRKLSSDGIAIIGADARSAVRNRPFWLTREMNRHFRHVFEFSVNGACIQARLLSSPEYVLVIGCFRKGRT